MVRIESTKHISFRNFVVDPGPRKLGGRTDSGWFHTILGHAGLVYWMDTNGPCWHAVDECGKIPVNGPLNRNITELNGVFSSKSSLLTRLTRGSRKNMNIGF